MKVFSLFCLQTCPTPAPCLKLSKSLQVHVWSKITVEGRSFKHKYILSPASMNVDGLGVRLKERVNHLGTWYTFPVWLTIHGLERKERYP